MSSVDRVILKWLPNCCWCDSTNFQYLVDVLCSTASQQKPTGISSGYDPSSVRTLALVVVGQLFNSSASSKDNEILLRRTDGDQLVLHLLLSCLGAFTNQPCVSQSVKLKMPPRFSNECFGMPQISNNESFRIPQFAKGVGFTFGGFTETWNVKETVLHQTCMDQHVIVLLQMLSNYINPGELTSTNRQPLPLFVYDQLLQSCLLKTLSSYLSNDSVLDIAKHIPLYRSVMQLLRALAQEKQLVSLLVTHKAGEVSILSLLLNMNTVIETYSSQLNKISKLQGKVKSDEDLFLLIPDIQFIADLVKTTVEKQGDEKSPENLETSKQEVLVQKSLEHRYLKAMKPLQFVMYEMMTATREDKEPQFVVPYYFRASVETGGVRRHPVWMKRLAQEMTTLKTSLPLSLSSSVFVCCDADRMDVMKVLITGPAETPYANGCFELDVYFPPIYPNTPLLIKLKTTSGQKVQINPNLYTDGTVCLSILNTWAGRPEERWNPQTSNLLQVLVSIQSLILVPKPIFNEPACILMLGTPFGEESSYFYNTNVKLATTRWAMLEQLRNPSPCFKQVIETHFRIKSEEIKNQIEGWISEIEAHSQPSVMENFKTCLKNDYQQLCDELAKLKPSSED